MGGEVRPWLTLLIVIVTVAALMGQAQDPQKAAPPGEAASIRFVDDTAASGLVFEHFNGARGQFYFPEIAGAGGGLLDYDGDGDLDVYLANGSSPAKNPIQLGTPPRGSSRTTEPVPSRTRPRL